MLKVTNLNIKEKFMKNTNTKRNNIFQNERIIVSKKDKFRQKGNYILENTIGEGAFAKVKLARHIITGEKVAIKILPKQNFSFKSNSINNNSNNNISKIHKEINILRRLHHKNIIQLYEIIETKNNLYLVMEYCEGKELFDYIVKRKRLTEREACRYFQQIINGVEYLHLCNITHRDLKPENILLDNKKRVRISDFGLSGLNMSYDSKLSTLCGTPLYAPPEMLKGEKYDGVYSDIWSCGIILYTMIVGDLPYADSKEKMIYQNIITHNYYYPEFMSDDAVDLIEHMLKINPNERYGFKEIKAHPWFNLVTPKLRPGIIYNVHKIPVDEKILDIIEKMGYDRNMVKKSVLENKYDSLMAIYLLTLKQRIREGEESISDLFSDEFIKYINDYKNWIDTSKINSPLFNEYNVINAPNTDLSDENFNINMLNEDIEIISDSGRVIIDENLDNFSNGEKNDYLNIIKKQSDEIMESFNNNDNGYKRLILRNSLMKEIKDIGQSKKENNKSFDSNKFSYNNIEEEIPAISNKSILTTKNSKKIFENKLIKTEQGNKLKKYKKLVGLKTEMKKNKKTAKNKNTLHKNLNINDIIKKRIFKQNAQKKSPSKFNPIKNDINQVNKSLLSPIIFDKRINDLMEEENHKNKLNHTINANNRIFNNNIEETEYIDKIFNENLIDLESDTNLLLTRSGGFQDNNSESKTFFSKDENNLSINSGNNNTINISKKITKEIKKINLNGSKNNNMFISKTSRNSANKKSKNKKKDNDILLTEPLDINLKNRLKEEIQKDIFKFDNDLKIIDDISKNKFIQYDNNLNSLDINENIGLFNIQNFADKLIKTTIFKNYLVRNNKNIKNEIENKFYILEKYKNCLGLIEKLKNKIFMEKLSNFNFYTFDLYLNDEDDKIISNKLLKDKNLSLFINKAKETLFNNSNTISKRSFSKNNSFKSNNLLDQNYYISKIRSKTPKSQLNNIIMNHTQNYFYKQKNKKYNNNLYGSLKTSLLKKDLINKSKDKSLFYQNYSPDIIQRKNILKHSIDIKTNKNMNKDFSSNKIKNKSMIKRLKFRKNNYLTENKFRTTNNSIRKFNLDNSNSSINSIIIEEVNNNDNNDRKNKINIRKITTNDSNKKLFLKKNNILNNNNILKTENKLKKHRKFLFNNLIQKVDIGANSDKKLLTINFENRIYENKFRNKTSEKITRKKDVSLTPEIKKSMKYKKIIMNKSLNNRKEKTQKFIDNKKASINLNINNNKSNMIKKTINNIKIQNKNELKLLKDDYPIDMNCILLNNIEEVKIKIRKFFKKNKCTINEKENNIKIFKSGFNIEINCYTLKDIEINNVYLCFKLKGEIKKNNLEFINNSLLYLHKKD